MTKFLNIHDVEIEQAKLLPPILITIPPPIFHDFLNVQRRDTWILNYTKNVKLSWNSKHQVGLRAEYGDGWRRWVCTAWNKRSYHNTVREDVPVCVVHKENPSPTEVANNDIYDLTQTFVDFFIERAIDPGSEGCLTGSAYWSKKNLVHTAIVSTMRWRSHSG